jgi:hypothetical protein
MLLGHTTRDLGGELREVRRHGGFNPSNCPAKSTPSGLKRGARVPAPGRLDRDILP